VVKAAREELVARAVQVVGRESQAGQTVVAQASLTTAEMLTGVEVEVEVQVRLVVRLTQRARLVVETVAAVECPR
jgi:hypothetical protein